MDFIRKLPLLLSGIMAIVIGITSLFDGSDKQSTYIKMAVFMVVFYIAGIIIRNTLNSIYQELEKKKRQKAEDKLSNNAEKAINEDFPESSRKTPAGHKVDLMAGETFDDEFTPLTVSKIITAKINER